MSYSYDRTAANDIAEQALQDPQLALEIIKKLIAKNKLYVFDSASSEILDKADFQKTVLNGSAVQITLKKR